MPSLRFCRCYSHFCSQFFIGEPWKKPVRKDGKLYLYSSSKFGLSQGSAESSTFFARATKNGWLKRIISRWNFLQLVITEYLHIRLHIHIHIDLVSNSDYDRFRFSNRQTYCKSIYLIQCQGSHVFKLINIFEYCFSM